MKVFGIIALVIMLVGWACFFIIPGWYGAGIVISAFIGIVAFAQKRKEKKETMCAKCKKKYDYDSEVEWREIRRWTKTGPNTTSSNTAAQLFYQIEFKCTCSDCGTRKVYKKKIGGPRITNNGEYEDQDVEHIIQKMFNNEPVSTVATVIAYLFCIVLGVALLCGGIYFA